MSKLVEINFNPDTKTLRQFGVIASVGFGVLAALAFYERLIFSFGLGAARMPVVRELAGGHGQDLGGQVGRPHPGQDQEAGVVDDAVQVALALVVAPADEPVAWGALPGAGTEAEQGDGSGAGMDEIASCAPARGV